MKDEAGEWGFAGVFYGEAGVDGEVRLRRDEMYVEIVGGEGERGALVIGYGYGGFGGLFGGGIFFGLRVVLVPVEEDLAVRCGWVGLIGLGCLGWSWRRCLGECERG